MSKRKAKRPWLGLNRSTEMLAKTIQLPMDELIVVEEAPAKVDGTVVGTVQRYEDGSIGVIIDEDAPQWAKDKIKATGEDLGLEIGEL